jgi:hypothetical protein
MSELRSHCPFGHLKHKLWPNERPGIKLAVWLPTTKRRESTRFPHVQATCDIPLESSWRRLQLCFRLHCNRRSIRDVMNHQSHKESQMWEFWDSHPRQKTIWMWPPWRVLEYSIRGKVVASFKFGPWCVLWLQVARGSSYHQKCSNYALTTLCWFCAGLCEWLKLVTSS